jgi:hypothetical protein
MRLRINCKWSEDLWVVHHITKVDGRSHILLWLVDMSLQAHGGGGHFQDLLLLQYGKVRNICMLSAGTLWACLLSTLGASDFWLTCVASIPNIEKCGYQRAQCFIINLSVILSHDIYIKYKQSHGTSWCHLYLFDSYVLLRDCLKLCGSR